MQLTSDEFLRMAQLGYATMANDFYDKFEQLEAEVKEMTERRPVGRPRKTPGPVLPLTPVAIQKPKKTYRRSAAVRRRMSMAQKSRWKTLKAAPAEKPAAAAAHSRFSPEARRKMSISMRKSWAKRRESKPKVMHAGQPGQAA